MHEADLEENVMAINLNRSGMICAEVNNYTNGETRVWIKDKEIPLEEFCGLVWKIFQEKARLYASGRKFLERARQLKIVPGFYKYTERLALPKEMPALEAVMRSYKNDYAICPIEIAGVEIDFYDLTIFIEYFFTNSDLMSRRDPRLELLEKLKDLEKTHL